MPSPAFVRLGPSSATKSRALADSPPGPYEDDIELSCAQVPHDFEPGSPIWLWLGSDNNKGQPTDWDQGIRAYGICKENERQEGTRNFDITISDLFILPRAISKSDLLEASPETYARELSDASIVGLNNYSSQVVQLLDPREFASVGAIISHIIPEVAEAIAERVPDTSSIEIIPRPESEAEVETKPHSPKPETWEIADDDPVFQKVRALLFEDHASGVMLTGVPGTGKSWYARQIALRLTEGNTEHLREIQFHPSYQYEDFVEGMIPDGSAGFRLVDKHLLQMCLVARSTTEPVVILIDEFSRTDPARVLGEALTYMEATLRDKEFRLTSGRKAVIPPNLIFLATMNPEDRSVDEIDDAMERRWSKVELLPNREVVANFLTSNGADGLTRGAAIQLFEALQEHLKLGHAVFRNVSGKGSLERLWESQIWPMVQKKYRFDDDSRRVILDIWRHCNDHFAEPAATEAAQPDGENSEESPTPQT